MRKCILLAAYGPSTPAGRSALQRFEKRCRARFPQTPIRWAFTSPLLRDRLARNRQKSDSVAKALTRLYYEKFESVIIQPLHAICGSEYEEVCAASRDITSQTGLKCPVGSPLLHKVSDVPILAERLLLLSPKERKPDEDIIFMGHGAWHPSGALYEKLGATVNNLDRHAHIGGISGSITLHTLLGRLSSRRVWLMPLLAIIGTHALRDMAGSGASSWKTGIEAAGHQCEAVLKGLAESDFIADIWLENLNKAAKTVAETQEY